MSNIIQTSELLKSVEGWMHPPTPEEKAIVQEVSKLPVIEVFVLTPGNPLVALQMQPRECHNNCTLYVEADPERESTVVFGWIKDEGVYTLHSVISQDDNLYCITPNEFKQKKIKFIPDHSLSCIIPDDGEYIFKRNGITIAGFGLRENPDITIAEGKRIKELLQAGIHPYNAVF